MKVPTVRLNDKTKLYIKSGLLTIVAGFLIVLCVKVYDYSYKSGFQEGTRNQVICQAAQRNDDLKPLCR
jgi:hypothetical protein